VRKAQHVASTNLYIPVLLVTIQHLFTVSFVTNCQTCTFEEEHAESSASSSLWKCEILSRLTEVISGRSRPAAKLAFAIVIWCDAIASE
jgi:hypothetical protein